MNNQALSHLLAESLQLSMSPVALAFLLESLPSKLQRTIEANREVLSFYQRHKEHFRTS
jgi:hypothetical protein